MTSHCKLCGEMGCQKLKTRRVRFQQKQRELEQRGCVQADGWSVCPEIARNRIKAESFEEVCWRTDRSAQRTTITRHDINHSTCNNASKSWRSDVPIILPGWEHHNGGSWSKPTVHPCLVRQGGCGLLTQEFLTNAQMSPTLRRGSGATVATVPRSLRSVHKTRQDETVCVSGHSLPESLVEVRARRFRSNHRQNEWTGKSCNVLFFRIAVQDDPEDRGDPASAVPGVLGQGEGCRHDR